MVQSLDDIRKDEGLRTEFLVESHENLDQLDRDFVALEADPSARGRVDAIFRTIHTLKGTAGFLGFTRLEELAHAGEGLLTRVREEKSTLTPAMTSALLAMVDRVRAMLRVVEHSGHDDAGDHAEVLERLRILRTHAEPGSTAVAATDAKADEARSAPTVLDGSVRVDVRLLDDLMNLVGELVLARNQILQVGSRIEDPRFVGASQRLDHCATELQQQVMKTRMQPIGTLWSKLPRVVRDLSVQCGKEVRVEMFGEGTELDRTIIDAIKDPLTHIVRNAIDHGIEAPDLRAAKGKARVGTLTLRAFHAGGQVNIEIGDDGAGLALDRIRQKGVERGLVAAERVAELSDAEVAQLVFVPGFSTASRITNVSGRGVGMDVVKTNIERIGGTVDILIPPSGGTRIKIKIPLTLAIVPALTVAAGGRRYAIPQVSLLELVRIEQNRIAGVVESVRGTPVLRRRGRLLPLVLLKEQLGHVDRDWARRDLNVVVLQVDERQVGLIVDEVGDTEEIVVKPLGKELKGVSVFAGATIMGDGRIALILDVAGLAHHAGAGRIAGDVRPLAAPRETSTHAEERDSLLLFTLGEEGTAALPLSSVSRLEEFPRARLERAGGRWVVQYRGELLQLIDLSGALETGATVSDAPVRVVVHANGDRRVGLVVERIVDVVEDSVRLDRRGAATGLLGSAIIQGRVTDVLDVEAVIRRAFPAFFVDAPEWSPKEGWR